MDSEEIKSAIEGLKRGIEWIEPIRKERAGVGRIKFVMNHALIVLKKLHNEQNAQVSDTTGDEQRTKS